MPAARRVMFRGTIKRARSQKEAYLWLLDQFIETRPEILENNLNRIQIITGSGRKYLDQNPRHLWEKSPHLFEERLFQRLSGGWYANTNLDEATKLDVLRRFARIAGFKEGRDWSWDETVIRPPDLSKAIDLE